jgi:anthranilate synthase component II
VSLDIARELHGEIAMLGVCLGHQTIAAALGGRVVRGAPVHGRASMIEHDARGLFEGVPNPMWVGRYHSLVVEEATLPSPLTPTARTEGGVLMAFAHRDAPVFGVQFHPESILTQHGYLLLDNFLRLAGIDTTIAPSELEAAEFRSTAIVAPLSTTVTPHAWGELP